MSFLDRMDHRFGRFAIPGLIRYVVLMNALVYILIEMNHQLLVKLLLWPGAILAGEVWRLVTYIFIPQFGGFFPRWFNAAMYMMFLWWIGDGLENALGSFKLNVYYLGGMIGLTVAAFIESALTGSPGGLYSAGILNTSLLFAFAQFYPDEFVFLYFFPVKVKWLAIVAAVLLIYEVPSGGVIYVITVCVALSNYFLFFGPEFFRNAKMQREVSERRRKFEAAKAPATESLHQCTVCNRTEKTHPDLEFRVSRDGEEYCLEHLPKAAVRSPGEKPI